MEVVSPSPLVQKLTLDPDGDVFLQLAGYDIQISSKILSVASPVWKAMFSVRFAEGAQLAAGHPCHVALPDDDPLAMITLCEVLHHRTNTDERHSIQDMVNLAVVTDKYDCVTAMSRHASLYFAVFFRSTGHISRPNVPYGRLLWPAFIFDDPYAFQQITKFLVYNPPEVVCNGMPTVKKYGISPDIKALLPEDLLESILVKEWIIKTTLLEGIEKLAKDIVAKDLRLDTLEPQPLLSIAPHSKTQISQCDCFRVMAYLKQLATTGVWPVTHAMINLRLHQIIEQLRMFRLGQADNPAVYPGKLEPCATCQRDFGRRLMFLREEAVLAFKGYCLDCVKHGGPESVPEGRCRNADAVHVNISDQC